MKLDAFSDNWRGEKGFAIINLKYIEITTFERRKKNAQNVMLDNALFTE